MIFDDHIERRGTNCTKWDRMETLFGVSPDDGLAMWTADSDYRTAPCVIEAVHAAAEHGIFGYSWPFPDYLNAICWWMRNRHDWTVEPDWILTAQGLGNAIALCLDVWSDPGDGVVIFTPVYHEFRLKTEKAGRRVVECPLARDGDSYGLDLDDAQSRLTGSEKVLLWCSPQNPSGRIWSTGELRAVADFAERNNLVLVADEIHHDVVYPGNRFVPFGVAAPHAGARTVILTSASKTFNIAGQRTGNMIIPDARLRAQMQHRIRSLDYCPSDLGVRMITAAYSPDGAKWVDALIDHLDGNRQYFDRRVNALPGIRSLPLQATFLAWVDFAGTGMSPEETAARIRDDARIAVSPGPGFGPGGETFQRFNFAAPRSLVERACDRLDQAFADLQ